MRELQVYEIGAVSGGSRAIDLFADMMLDVVITSVCACIGSTLAYQSPLMDFRNNMLVPNRLILLNAIVLGAGIGAIISNVVNFKPTVPTTNMES
jgi:hypothetical protein